MIPCAAGCPRYCPGCHKTCAQWPERVRRQQADYQARMAWLRDQQQACSALLRSCRAISPCRYHRYY